MPITRFEDAIRPLVIVWGHLQFRLAPTGGSVGAVLGAQLTEKRHCWPLGQPQRFLIGTIMLRTRFAYQIRPLVIILGHFQIWLTPNGWLGGTFWGCFD